MSAYQRWAWVIVVAAAIVIPGSIILATTLSDSEPEPGVPPKPIPTVTAFSTPRLTPTTTVSIPVPTLIPTSIPDGTVFGPSVTLGIPRSRIQSEFEGAGYRFSTHTPVWVVGHFFDGTGSSVSLEVFGNPGDIEAVELWFGDRNNGEVILLSMELIMLRLAPSWTDQLLTWFRDNYRQLEEAELSTTVGPLLIKMQRSQRSKLVMLSFEGKPGYAQAQ